MSDHCLLKESSYSTRYIKQFSLLSFSAQCERLFFLHWHNLMSVISYPGFISKQMKIWHAFERTDFKTQEKIFRNYLAYPKPIAYAALSA